MRFGMLNLYESPADADEERVIGQQLELMRATEDLGFDSAWVVEHHFSDLGYCASPRITHSSTI